MNDKNTGIFDRFEKRKKAVAQEKITEQQVLPEQQILVEQQIKEKQEQINQLEDADMPGVETLDKNTDFSVFMSEKVSEALRKKALRKLFLLDDVNVPDGLNDYDEDYTSFEKLGNIIPYDLKQSLAREAEKLKAELAKEDQNEAEEEIDNTLDDQGIENTDEPENKSAV